MKLDYSEKSPDTHKVTIASEKYSILQEINTFANYPGFSSGCV